VIIEIFALLAVIALFLIGLGYAVDVQAYSLIGFLFLFLLSIIFLNSTLEIQSGFNETIVNENLTRTDYNYSAVSMPYTYGLYLAIMCVVGFALVLIGRIGWRIK
jgi:hypothetical protein